MAEIGLGISCTRSFGGIRLDSKMAVNPFHRIFGREREHAGDHFVEQNPVGVEIAPGIRRTIYSAGLFGRHVRQSRAR